MNTPLLIFMLLLAFGAGWLFGHGEEECPREIMHYNCRGYECNHSRSEVDRAKRAMRQDPPTFNFRP